MTELSQLKWQCRRGIKELDLVLGLYLQQHYSKTGKKEQNAFKALLQLEDPILYDLLLGNSHSQDEHQIRLLKTLRRLS